MAGASLSTNPQEPSLSFQSSPLLHCMLPASTSAAISLSQTGGIVCFLVVGKGFAWQMGVAFYNSCVGGGGSSGREVPWRRRRA